MPSQPTRLQDQLVSGRTRDDLVPRGWENTNRLVTSITPERPPKPGEIADRIEGRYRDASFVVDSSFFDASLETNVWKALLARHGRVMLLPQVRTEIGGWLERNGGHPAAGAVIDNDSLEVCDPSAWPQNDIRVLEYYMNLLGVRKRLYRLTELNLEHALGRVPTTSEVTRAKKEAANALGLRAALLARKGIRADSASETFYTDEAVVAAAFITAIRRRRTTVILTRDEDVSDQFYKMQWLLDTHYRGMLFAEAYVASLSARNTIAMPSSKPWSDAFAPGPNRLVARSNADLDAILPRSAGRIMIECWLFREGELRLTFAADDTMGALLNIKARTGGLNSERLLPRNCHIWLAPLPISMEFRGCAAIAVDRRVALPKTGLEIPALDFNQALLTEERQRPATPGVPTLWRR